MNRKANTLGIITMIHMMTNMTFSNIKRSIEWHLLVEMELTDEGQSSKDQIAEVIQSMQLNNDQKERIYKALLHAFHKAYQRTQNAERFKNILLRIWSSKQEVKGDGWGFFVVDKPGFESHLAVDDTTYVVELFIYQERHQ